MPIQEASESLLLMAIKNITHVDNSLGWSLQTLKHNGQSGTPAVLLVSPDASQFQGRRAFVSKRSVIEIGDHLTEIDSGVRVNSVLMQVVSTLVRSRSFPCRLNGWQQKTGNGANDCNRNQKFYQRECSKA